MNDAPRVDHVMAAPASLHAHRHRQAERLASVVDRLWHRDDGAHQSDLRRLLALVDHGSLTYRDAHEVLADLDYRTRGARAA